MPAPAAPSRGVPPLHPHGLRTDPNLCSQLVEMTQVGPQGLEQRLDALSGHSGTQQVALNAEDLQSLGLIPDQAPGDRGGIDIEPRNIGRAPPSVRPARALKAHSPLLILSRQPP